MAPDGNTVIWVTDSRAGNIFDRSLKVRPGRDIAKGSVPYSKTISTGSNAVFF